ncbi:hypothetical protein IC762_26675 [Bradyrhizobium genosp. L]|uniref:hypothetical protein n=1 Tax=Bradyrhizobium genosp. L TaxID=83637 RepID=UPI0018A2AB83|nr:hypothetical protein [Bradyrhizobium genosp. L]QPF83272.1 hypothetical protein IC762_26675 [Bradyrhizobium genosp. L]
MPAFTFEKILPPGRRSPVAPAVHEQSESKPRGLMVQMLDRFVEARIRRKIVEDKAGEDKVAIVSRDPAASE